MIQPWRLVIQAVKTEYLQLLVDCLQPEYLEGCSSVHVITEPGLKVPQFPVPTIQITNDEIITVVNTRDWISTGALLRWNQYATKTNQRRGVKMIVPWYFGALDQATMFMDDDIVLRGNPIKRWGDNWTAQNHMMGHYKLRSDVEADVYLLDWLSETFGPISFEEYNSHLTDSGAWCLPPGNVCDVYWDWVNTFWGSDFWAERWLSNPAWSERRYAFQRFMGGVSLRLGCKPIKGASDGYLTYVVNQCYQPYPGFDKAIMLHYTVGPKRKMDVCDWIRRRLLSC